MLAYFRRLFRSRRDIHHEAAMGVLERYYELGVIKAPHDRL